MIKNEYQNYYTFLTDKRYISKQSFKLPFITGLELSKQDEMRMIIQYLTLSTGEP